MLTLEKLSLQIGDFALHDISLEIKKGEYFVILGRTGSGKTLLLESIAGIRPVSGRILLEEKEITDLVPEKRHIGFVYQDFMLFPHKNVRQNILFSAAYLPGGEDPARLKELLGLLQIEALVERDVRTLSGGEKQRVAIARALYAQPDVLLLDEPLSAVDPSMRDQIMDLLKHIAEHYGVTIVHVTHNFREAACLAERIAILLDGRIVQTGSADEVLAHPKTLQVARFLGFKNIFEGSLLGIDAPHISIDPNAIRLCKEKPHDSPLHRTKLLEVRYAVDHYKVYTELAGHTLFLKTPKPLFAKLKLQVGDECYLCIDEKGVLPL